MTFEPETYDSLPDPEHDPEAAEALMDYAADHDPDSDAEIAIGAALDRATKGWKDAQTALSEARTYGVAANHAAYNGPVSAARYAATACRRAADRARDAWQRAYEAADDAGSIAHADPDAAGSARQAAEGATVCARLARRGAYEARLEAEKAADAEAAARSDQRAPAPPIEALADDLINTLGQARAAFSYLAVSHPIATDRPAFGRRAASAALLLTALREAAGEDFETHACPACEDRTLTGAANTETGLCPDCQMAEAEKAQE
jgi:hypothetical protein